MASLAQELGVPADRVRVEVTSTSTWENAVVSAPLLRGWGMTRVLLVTDRLHMRRAAAVFARAGLVVEPVSVPIYEGHEDNVSMLLAGLREFAALAVYRARGRLGEPGAVQAAAGQPAFETTMRMISNPTGPIVLLGASYAQGWPLEQVAGVRVINRGEEGQQSFELAERFDRDVVSASPRAVVLWGFINDIFRAPPGGEMDQVLSVIRDSYTRMIAMARQHGIEPVLATEVTARPRAMSVMDTLAGWAGALRGKEAYQDGVNRHVMAVNQWIVSLGAREDLLVLDFQSVLSEPGGRRHRPFAQPDGSHITTAGYRALTTYATPLLEEHLVGR
jgi:lysophospholipase L1-like esterase